MARHYRVVILALFILLATPAYGLSIDFSTSIDNWIHSYYQNDTYGTQDYMIIGTSAAGWAFRGVYQSDISSLPSNGTVTSAILKMYEFQATGTATMSIRLSPTASNKYLLLNESQMSWNKPKTGQTWTGGDPVTAQDVVVTAPGLASWTSWDITSIVQYYIVNDLDLQYMTVIMRRSTEGTNANNNQFRTKEYTGTYYDPYLVITYSLPAAPVCPGKNGTPKDCQQDGTAFDGGTQYDDGRSAGGTLLE